MKSIYDLLVKWHNNDPNFNFLEYKRSYTLNDVLYEVESLSKSLSFISSHHIGIHISSKLDFILLYLACIKSNKIPVVLKTTWGRDEINSIVNNYEIQYVICNWSDKSIFNKHINTYFLEELINSSRGCGIPTLENRLENYESVVFTSGSTGFPKGVCLQRRNFYNSSLSWNEQINFNSYDRYAICLPMHHISGLAILYRSIFFKFGLDLLDSYDQIDTSNSSIVSFVPSILIKLIDNSEYHDSLKSFKAIIIGGESICNDLIDKCMKLKLNIFISYGMTETCSGISGFWLNNYKERYESVGIPFSNVDISTTTNNEILISSAMNMLGYYKKTKQKGPFVSSDIGRIKDGFLYLHGRCDDIVIFKGEKINLKYIENTLLQHDLIDSVEVKIEKYQNLESIIKATVKSKDNILNEEMIKIWCETKLGKYKTPNKIIILNM